MEFRDGEATLCAGQSSCRCCLHVGEVVMMILLLLGAMGVHLELLLGEEHSCVVLLDVL